MPEAPSANGSCKEPLPLAPLLGRRPKVGEIFKVLETDYGVPAELLEQLGEAVGRAAARVVDDAVTQRRMPLAYRAVRIFDTDGWLR